MPTLRGFFYYRTRKLGTVSENFYCLVCLLDMAWFVKQQHSVFVYTKYEVCSDCAIRAGIFRKHS